ncbi:MAG: c-type cytochrome [Burkholderiaceae bacterium]|jgi:cytochrome c|nr:c-type cytochrome [Burkholderiaceae bacterium]
MNNLSTSSYPSVLLRFFGVSVFAGLLFCAKPVYADNEQLKKLMLTNNCLACHQIDKRKYGPNFLEVAEKYKGDSSVLDKLATKIKAGGTGVWGEDYMPPQPQVSDADAKSMAQLILSLKP